MSLVQETSFEKKLKKSLEKLVNRFNVVLEYAIDNEDGGYMVRVCDKDVWRNPVFKSLKTQIIFDLINEEGYEPILFFSPLDNNIEFEPTQLFRPKSFIDDLLNYKVNFNILSKIQVKEHNYLVTDICKGSSKIVYNRFQNSSYTQGA